MSSKMRCLHSHSGLERSLRETAKDKFHVLVDEEFADMFPEDQIKPFKHKGKTYYKVPTYLFARKGGVFKNLNE